MFIAPPPQVRDLAVYSRLPNHFRQVAETAWSSANRPYQPLDSFLEGPVFDRAGNLYVCDIPFGRIFRIDRQRTWSLVAHYDGEPNGLKFLDDDHLLAADYRRGLMRIDVRDGSVTPHLARRHSESFRGLNDLVFDAHGTLYFTDQGQSGLHDPSGRLYRLDRHGQLNILIDGIPSPNGVCLAPDGRTLFLAVTRANSVWHVPLQPDGGVAKVGQFFASYGPAGPDGLAMSADGHLVVANPGLGYVWVLSNRAEPVVVLRSTDGMSITNLAYGGEGNCTLFCTESSTGTILIAQMPSAGLQVRQGSGKDSS